MCGIFGYISRDKSELSQDVIRAMGDLLVHRGPDDVGIHFGEGVALGNRRLSILDIEGGHQPFVSDDGNIIVVQNGEIFNHIELTAELNDSGYPCETHCDTEVILRLYERDGIEMLSKLNGMFAIAILDQRKNEFYLIRDRIGVKPLYLHDDGNRLIFASEIKSILATGILRKLNPQALDYYLTFNYVPQPLTMFKDIVHLEPGHYLKVNSQTTEKVRWWNLTSRKTEEQTEEEWIDEFNSILDDAVRIRLRSDVPFGAFLSGGVDSSTVVGIMSQHLNQPVNTYSIGFHEDKYDESPYAAQAAERFKTKHTMKKVDANMLDLWPMATWYCDQPHGDISFLPTYRVSELAAEHVKVVLTGDGADELFAGYDKYKDFFSNPKNEELDDKAFREAYYRQLNLFDNEARSQLYADDFKSEIDFTDARQHIDALFNEAAGMDRINQALYIDMQYLLSGNNLVKPDRMGMAVSLEARTPFLDYRMMEFAFRMPGSLKLRDGETKYIYKKAVKELIGEELAYRKKQMFTVPVGEWFKTSLSTFVKDLLLSDVAVNRGIFKEDYIRRLISEHSFGEKNHTREIRALLALEIWFRIFIDNPDLHVPDFNKLGINL